MINSQVLLRTVKNSSWIKDVSLVIGASILMALSAQVKIPLPFTPIPISMQSLTILYLAMLLGSKRGALAVLTYLAQGACGLPVFSGTGTGLLYMAGPTGGYLVGFAIAAYVSGLIVERSRAKSSISVCAAFIAGTAVIHFFGAAWLLHFVGSIRSAICLGVVPFLIGDAIKLVLTVAGIKAVKSIRSF